MPYARVGLVGDQGQALGEVLMPCLHREQCPRVKCRVDVRAEGAHTVFVSDPVPFPWYVPLIPAPPLSSISPTWVKHFNGISRATGSYGSFLSVEVYFVL